jgi:hypothetical protein
MAHRTNVEWLLADLCEELGFSLPLRDVAKFEKVASAGADAFADEVMRAEGLDPATNKQLRNKVRDRVAKHLTQRGADAV